jgi:hypothetical protein
MHLISDFFFSWMLDRISQWIRVAGHPATRQRGIWLELSDFYLISPSAPPGGFPIKPAQREVRKSTADCRNGSLGTLMKFLSLLEGERVGTEAMLTWTDPEAIPAISAIALIAGTKQTLEASGRSGACAARPL